MAITNTCDGAVLFKCRRKVLVCTCQYSVEKFGINNCSLHAIETVLSDRFNVTLFLNTSQVSKTFGLTFAFELFGILSHTHIFPASTGN